MITDICQKLEFPIETTKHLSNIYHTLLANSSAADGLFCAMDQLFGDGEGTHEEYLKRIAEETGVHKYTVDMVFYLMCSRPLRYIYLQKGLPEAVFWNTMCDLRYKLLECKKRYDIWGTFVGFWFRDFFLCKRFALGRLQYERQMFKFDDYKGIVKKGDTVYNCHIPSSGPLTPESVIDSLKCAYRFYRSELKNGILPVYCDSWMLYPPTAELYPRGSNLRKFYELFEVLESQEQPENNNFWRIFYVRYNPETWRDVPATSTLQRNIKQALENGINMGSGKAILLFDGKSLI